MAADDPGSVPELWAVMSSQNRGSDVREVSGMGECCPSQHTLSR